MLSPDLRRFGEPTDQERRLPPGFKLLLSGPGSVLPFAFQDESSTQTTLVTSKNMGIAASVGHGLSEYALARIISEYAEIHALTTSLVGAKNLVVARNPVILGKNIDGALVTNSLPVPQQLDFNSQEIGFLETYFKLWPRDSHTVLGDQVLSRSDSWRGDYPKRKVSLLGEGGKVLTRKKAVLVTPDVWRYGRDEVMGLMNLGFKVGSMPFVEAGKQEYVFNEEHIDGHVTLIENDMGNMYLLVAKSYARQGGGTGKQLRIASETVGAELIEIEDGGLPPLAFNLLQFEDGAIAMTDGAKELEEAAAQIMGKERVFSTRSPLEIIPSMTRGGIRCLTNLVPAVLV